MKLLLLNSDEHHGEIRACVEADEWPRSHYDSVIQRLQRLLRHGPDEDASAALRHLHDGVPITVKLPWTVMHAALKDAASFIPQQHTGTQQRAVLTERIVPYSGVRFHLRFS